MTEADFTITQIVDEHGLNARCREGWRLKETIIVEEIVRLQEPCTHSRQYGYSNGYGSSNRDCSCPQCTAAKVHPGSVVKQARFVIEGPGSLVVTELEKLLEGLRVENRKLADEKYQQKSELEKLRKIHEEEMRVSNHRLQLLDERERSEKAFQTSARKYEVDMGKLRKELGEARMREILGT